jgi:bacterial/archaeal transporter family protein
MRSLLSSWQLWAVLSAAFTVLTAIFAKVGAENLGLDFATFIRTIVILFAAAAIPVLTGQSSRWGCCPPRLRVSGALLSV